MKKLLLIDGSSYFYRAFHALPPLTNSKGQPTGAIYGVVNMIKRLLTDYTPDYIAVIFDAKGENFRHTLYPDYKAHRPPMPDDLRSQFEPMLQLIESMGLPIIVKESVEADDVIATLAHYAEKNGWQTLISTGDKDMAQLVNEHTTLINTMTQTLFDRQKVIEKFEVSPEQIGDYLSLLGDKVDNVPGVAGVGQKTAVQWLKTYGTLDNLIARADEIKGKIGETLRASLDKLQLSRQLIALKHDVPLTIIPEDLQLKPRQTDKLIAQFQELEFKTWLKAEKVQHPEVMAVAAEKKTIEQHYTTILTQEDFTIWMDKLNAAEYMVFDTETTSLEPLNARLVGVSFAIHTGEAAYLPLGHDYLGAPAQLKTADLLPALKQLFENPMIKKIGQNLKYDYNVLKNNGIFLQGMAFDTMLESYMHNSSSSRHDMDTLAAKHLQYKTMTFEMLAGKGAKQLTFNQVELERAAFYACEDADITLQLHHRLWPMVATSEKMAHLFHTLEMPLLKILGDMEYRGVLIDAICLHKQSTTLAEKLKQLEITAFDLAGEVFNLQSPKQLQIILYEKNQLPVLQKTPTGQASTAEEVLQELALTYPLANIILEHRHLSKLKSTYTDALPQCIHPKTGRVHTSYNQAVTSTGRLSSSQPNLQNIPIRSEEGRKIRQAFIAPPGCVLISADYSQIELRIMAHLSQDPGLLNAFQQGLDIHQATAAEVQGIALENVTSDQRRQAKAVNFGLIYGMSAFGLAKQLAISREEAQRYIDLYFTRYPGVKTFMETTRQYAHQHSFVETIMGRRMPVPDIHNNNRQRQQGAERAAINAPLQGSAADIIKLAMIHADTWIQATTLDVNMIMQVHDELVFEVKQEHVDEAKQHIRHIMENAVSLSVPLTISLGVGPNWDAAH